MVPSEMHILVVDDEKDTRDFLHTMFKDAGFRVTCAADGLSALRVIRREAVDLTIVAEQMPGLCDGHEMVETARAMHPALKAMFISTDAEPDDYHAPHQNDFISKPFYGKEILGCAYKMLLHGRHPLVNQAA